MQAGFSRFVLVGLAILGSVLYGSASYAKDPDRKKKPKPVEQQPSTRPSDVVFEEKDGVVAWEAEHFVKQSKNEKRAWYLTTEEKPPTIEPDGDQSHVAGASGGAYLELLPDTRRDDDDKLVEKENFSKEPGRVAILTYKVYVNTPGQYWIWIRAYSTNSEDNSLHIGLDGAWPKTAQRWQTEAVNRWHWSSSQRPEHERRGPPGPLFFNVEKKGMHEVQLSMREDGCEIDRIVLAAQSEFRPEGFGPETRLHSGRLPKPFPLIPGDSSTTVAEAKTEPPASTPTVSKPMPTDSEKVPVAQAIVPDSKAPATADSQEPKKAFPKHWGDPPAIQTRDIGPLPDGYGLGSSTLRNWIQQNLDRDAKTAAEKALAQSAPPTQPVPMPAPLPVEQPSKSASPSEATAPKVAAKPAPKTLETDGPPLVLPRRSDGNGSVVVTGELKQWHKATLTLDGPYAHEQDVAPNAFTDCAMSVTFKHESGSPIYTVPGYFAADGNAAETGASNGTKWRAHFSPDQVGRWMYTVHFRRGRDAAVGEAGDPVKPYDGIIGRILVDKSTRTGTDFRAHGRLEYIGERYLRFAGTRAAFLKFGADAPETLLAYEDFDDTLTMKPDKGPLKKYETHVGDWRAQDPAWRGGKGKGLIGAVNYLSDQGVNSISFLTYNAGGDGDNVWPFIARNEKLHYDCSKLDQWGIVFDHAGSRGVHLHFKLQENELDDNRKGHPIEKTTQIFESLDGGLLGRERKLYCRELIARYGHALALNWNIGEENTQSSDEIRDMVKFLHETDPYKHPIVLHTFPNQQEKVYRPLLGEGSLLTGFSLQNSWEAVHRLTKQWIRESEATGRKWVVANDEQNPAEFGVPADPGFEGSDGTVEEKGKRYSLHNVRKSTLWGNLMAGGAGVEYYFGYKTPQHDLNLENFRSRHQSWSYGRIALEFFRSESIPFYEMTSADELVGASESSNERYCFAKPDSLYLVYLAVGGEAKLDLSGASRKAFQVRWFNPRTGGPLVEGSVNQVVGGAEVNLGLPPGDTTEDWLAVIR